MLTISPVNNIDYYANLAKEDYYLGSGEPPGVWRGVGARQLGLCNKIVASQEYQNLMRGFSPLGEALVQNAGKDKRRNAWDCTYSCPKSLSLLAAAGDQNLKQKILAAQESAVCKGIEFLERKAAITRRGKSGEQYERTAGLVVATFQHSTNREQQPQIHTHALICNVAPRHDLSWGSIDSRKLYQWQKASGAIYRAELAYQIQQLGFAVELDGESFRIAAIDSDICNEYSKRAQDINKALYESGIKSSASKSGQKIKLLTRKQKHSVDHLVLAGQWKEALAERGLDEETISQIKLANRVRTTKEIDADLILTEITETKAVFTEQEVYQKVAIAAVASNKNAREAEQIAKQILCGCNIIELAPDEPFSRYYTTQEVIDTERSMIQTAKELASQNSKQIFEKEIIEAIDYSEQAIRCSQKAQKNSFKFDDEQREAIFAMLNGGDFVVTQGSAGSGKTTTLLPVKTAFEQQGLKVEGACIAKRAADNLAEETGIKSRTVASIIGSIDDGKNPLKNIDVLIVDEAGQLPSTDLQQLLHAAKKNQCKVILTGEDKQLDSIKRGGALRYLSRPEIVGTQRIQNIRRQNKEWARTTVANFRDGKSIAALGELKRHKCLHLGETSGDTKQQLIADWHQYHKANPDKKTLVMAQRWENVKELSEIIRTILIKEGVVGQENIPLTCSIADKKFEYKFSIGDRVKFTRNEYQRLQVSNGTLGTIKEIQQVENDARLTVTTDDQRNLTFLASEYSDTLGTNLCLAYALTVYSSQGTTIDGNTFTLYSGGMDRANTYVALSRHKEESHLYVNRSEVDELAGAYDSGQAISEEQRMITLAKLMSRDNYSSLAIEHLPQREKSYERSIEYEIDI
ncbi:conjugative relaxase [Cellvibrio zantedeschiae]|uniref:Conjugative relaxase n=1 Tax=Cellvibrio zantedeschiae TaxID=1237077 RepID=A0ABQ3AM03_9GAMM|nr:MobF family relaxase [Cellvibrio zantedeschiae]GGY61524.1 conjugative relaxase [Cellvibrio zantedeschiae]